MLTSRTHSKDSIASSMPTPAVLKLHNETLIEINLYNTEMYAGEIVSLTPSGYVPFCRATRSDAPPCPSSLSGAGAGRRKGGGARAVGHATAWAQGAGRQANRQAVRHWKVQGYRAVDADGRHGTVLSGITKRLATSLFSQGTLDDSVVASTSGRLRGRAPMAACAAGAVDSQVSRLASVSVRRKTAAKFKFTGLACGAPQGWFGTIGWATRRPE